MANGVGSLSHADDTGLHAAQQLQHDDLAEPAHDLHVDRLACQFEPRRLHHQPHHGRDRLLTGGDEDDVVLQIGDVGVAPRDAAHEQERTIAARGLDGHRRALLDPEQVAFMQVRRCLARAFDRHRSGGGEQKECAVRPRDGDENVGTDRDEVRLDVVEAQARRSQETSVIAGLLVGQCVLPGQ